VPVVPVVKTNERVAVLVLVLVLGLVAVAVAMAMAVLSMWGEACRLQGQSDYASSGTFTCRLSPIVGVEWGTEA